MSLTCARSFVPALPGFAFLAILLAPLATAAAADPWLGFQESAALPPGYYDVATNDRATAGAPSTTDVEMPLADRVAALEQSVQEMQSVDEEDAEVAAACLPKQIPIIDKPTYKLRGRMFIDGVTYDDDDATAAYFNTDRENEFGFDTVRLGLQGDLYENMIYMVEVEFEGTEVDFKDVYAQMNSLPVVGHFRAGHFKEPIGLEELESSNWRTFMHRAPATRTFAPSRNYGGMVFNTLDPCEDVTWFLGAFRLDSDDSPTGLATQRDDRNDWSLSSRLAWLPYYDEPSGGRYLVHLGGSYSYRNSPDPAEFTTGAYIGNQGPIGVGSAAVNDEWNQVAAEAAVQWGAASVQSEYFQAFLTSGEEYHGAYVQVSYFLTGEHRTYRKLEKVFDRVNPFEPAFWVDTENGWCTGRGAWELAAAYSYANLRDGDVIRNAGGAIIAEPAFVDGVVLGVNWYLNPYSRVMFDYYHEITDFVAAAVPDSDANIFGVRWQVSW